MDEKKKVGCFKTVGELVDALSIYPRDRLIILDDDGDTCGIPKGAFDYWDSNQPDSPIALFLDGLLEEYVDAIAEKESFFQKLDALLEEDE